MMEGERTAEKRYVINPKQKKLAQKLLSQEFDGDFERLCSEVGIGMTVLYKWLGEVPFRKYLENLVEKRTYGEISVVWKALIDQCIKGNVTAIKLYFELKGKYKNDTNVAALGLIQILDDIPAGEQHD